MTIVFNIQDLLPNSNCNNAIKFNSELRTDLLTDYYWWRKKRRKIVRDLYVGKNYYQIDTRSDRNEMLTITEAEAIDFSGKEKK